MRGRHEDDLDRNQSQEKVVPLSELSLKNDLTRNDIINNIQNQAQEIKIRPQSEKNSKGYLKRLKCLKKKDRTRNLFTDRKRLIREKLRA